MRNYYNLKSATDVINDPLVYEMGSKSSPDKITKISYAIQNEM